MRNILLISMLLFAGCNCPECPECPEMPTQEFEEYIIHYWDSVKTHAEGEIDSFKIMAQYQVDTMRANMFTERDRMVAFIDSLKGSKIYGNLIIYEDNKIAKAIFDEETGRPIIVYEE